MGKSVKNERAWKPKKRRKRAKKKGMQKIVWLTILMLSNANDTPTSIVVMFLCLQEHGQTEQWKGRKKRQDKWREENVKDDRTNIDVKANDDKGGKERKRQNGETCKENDVSRDVEASFASSSA